jgi:Kef-type K+ transport system membrane component KefB
LNDLIPTLAIILLAAEGGALLAHLVGVPRVVGQIGAGIILGPSVTSLLSATGSVEGIAELGALAILGIAGLETNMAAMRQVGRAAFLAACGGVIVPFIAGAGVALLFGTTMIEAAFVGAILTATSVGITAATLHELGLMQTRAAITILGAAVIDDVLGLVVLGLVVSETAKGTSLVATLLPMALTIGGVWIVLRWVPSHLDRAMTALHGRGGGMAATVGLVLAAGWVVQTWGGLAGITGAYVAGLALAGSAVAPQVREGLIRAGEAFCVPVFFVSIGLAADLRTIGPVLPFALALLGVAVVGKLVGSAVGAAMSGLDRREASLVGIGMIARGEVALVAATVGLHSGAIDPGVYAAVVLVSVATTVIAPIGISLWCRSSGSIKWPSLEPVGQMAVPVAIATMEVDRR